VKGANDRLVKLKERVIAIGKGHQGLVEDGAIVQVAQAVRWTVEHEGSDQGAQGLFGVMLRVAQPGGEFVVHGHLTA